MNDLLIRRRRRHGPAACVVYQHLDRRAIDDIEPDDLTAAVAAYFECRCIEHQNVLQRLPEPGCERLSSVRFAPELDQLIDPQSGVGGRVFLIVRSDRPF